jgi:signal transduction histidine kinase
MPARSLERHFSRRMLPLAALAGLVLAIVPPLTYHAIALRKLRDQGSVYAAAVATGMHFAAERQPYLWRYNASKVLRATAPHRLVGDIAAVRVTDCEGNTIFGPSHPGPGPGRGGGPAGWAPFAQGTSTVGWVQVQMDPSDERARTFRLALLSTLLGLLLGGVLFLFPRRIVGRQAAELTEVMEQLTEAEAGLTEANRDLTRKVDEAVDHVRALSGQVVAVQEEERRRIARDLHDGLGQSLTAARIEIELARKGDLERLPEAGRACEEALSELRRAVRDLRPLELESGTLREALAAVAERFELRTGIATSLRFEGGEVRSRETSVYALRIMQEALTNVAKHASAHEVGVAVVARGDEVTLEVTDDGTGFDPAATPGAGLTGIRERCAFLGGSCSIESVPGQGTRISVRLPDREERKAS